MPLRNSHRGRGRSLPAGAELLGDLPPIPARQQARSSLRALDLHWMAGERRRFIVFAQGRSGGTMLGDLLDKHPRVHCETEILYRPVALPRVWCYAGRARHRDVVYGCRVKIYQLTVAQRVADPGRWLRSMTRLGWQVIYLRRDNLLRHVLSNAVLAQSGVFHRRRDDPTPAPRVRVDPEEILAHISMRQDNLRQEAEALARVPHLALRYEQDLLDVANRNASMTRAFEYLALDPVPVEPSLRRTASPRIADQVENYDELAAAVSGAGHDHFLDD